MTRKSWHLDRRTFLHGVGVTLGLPFLECMQVSAAEFQRPKRMCTIYFPYGASVPGDNHADRGWGWFPVREGDNFRYTNVMKPLEPLRQYVSVIGGLSHPTGRGIGGHAGFRIIPDTMTLMTRRLFGLRLRKKHGT